MSAVLIQPKIQILGASSVPFNFPADTSEDIGATINIPPLSATAIIRYRLRFSQTNNANAKTVRLRLGGIAGTDYLTAQNLASAAAFQFGGVIGNNAATNAQKGNVDLGGATALFAGPNVTGALDTSVATTLVITAQKGTGGDTVTLESYLVELIQP